MAYFEKFFGITLAIVLILGGTTLIGYPSYKSITANGQVEYCYVDAVAYEGITIYHMKGFRNWRSDRTLSKAMLSLDEVKDAAKTYGCELR